MRAFSCCLALVLLLPQCGGGTATSAEPKSAADDTDGSSDASAAPSSSKGDDDGDEQSTSDTPSTREISKGPNCDDGTCSKCGSGICLAGWYCDEKAGGGACSWLAECADKPTCACVTRVLGASCKCHEDSGALKVACD